MPKSKKNKIVHLTQVRKKGKDHKEDLIKQLETYVAKFKRVYIFDFDEAKSDRIILLRLRLKDHGRIFSGKNSLVTLTLRTIGTNTNTDFDDLIGQISGHRGLLFTDLECNKLVDLLDETVPEFCKRLLGYARLAPETTTMDVDNDDDDDDDEQSDDNADASGDDKDASKKKKMMKRKKLEARKKKKKSSKSKSDEYSKREVKFVKI